MENSIEDPIGRGRRMKICTTIFPTNHQRGVSVWAFVVLFGVISSLTFLQSVMAASGTDLNGDGKADIVWRNTKNGTVSAWFMNGTTITTSGFTSRVPLAWQMAGVGDVNGDGKADVIWRHTTSATVAIWMMNGVAITSVGFPASVPTAWAIQAVGDVNGDGKADLLWRNTKDGNTAIWLMNGTKIAASGFLGGVSVDWQIAGMGDVNGDHKADVIWRNATRGTLAVWLLNGLKISSVGFPGGASTEWEIQTVGDMNGDGKDDLIWQNINSDEVAVWLMNGAKIGSSGVLGSVPVDGTMAGVGDVNGDGKADVFWRKDSGEVDVWLMNGFIKSSVGMPGSASPDWAIQFPKTNGSSAGFMIFPTNGSKVLTQKPTLTINFGNQSSVLDPSTLVVTLDGINQTNLFTITPKKASAAIDLTGGQHFLKATIKDKTGAIIEGQSIFTVSAFEVFPVVTPTSGPPPLTVQFRAKAVFTDGGINHYRWDFEGDGVFDADDPGERTYTRTFRNQGTIKALLEVENDRNEKKRVTVPIQIIGIPPIPTARLNPSNGAGPLTVSFAGSARDTDGTIVKYEWDFEGDGKFDYSSTTTGNTTHTYQKQGTFPAVFRVTDNQGLTATVPVSTTTVRVGPPGTPTARILTAPFVQTAGTIINLIGTGTDPDGKIALYEWDFEGDGTFDASSTTSGTQQFTYKSPGDYTAVFRVTDNAGLSSLDTLNFTINFPVSLTFSGNTCNPQQGKTITFTTRISSAGSAPITLFIENEKGKIIRTLVNHEPRSNGTHTDIWDCKDDQGQVVQQEGIFKVDLQYEAKGKMISLASTANPGGQFLSITSGLQGPPQFNPLQNEFLNITFKLPTATEVSGSIRLLSSFDEIARLVERKNFGAGDHILHWDGTDTEGRFVLPPPGDRFVVGLTGHTLPGNALFVESSPQVTNVTASPNFFDPATPDFINPQNPTTTISYHLSKPASVSLHVVNTLTNSLLRIIIGANQGAGRNTLQWDGRNEQGLFADSGNYRLALKAIDAQGNASIVRYIPIRVVY